jgi:hypothetical protein
MRSIWACAMRVFPTPKKKKNRFLIFRGQYTDSVEAFNIREKRLTWAK